MPKMAICKNKIRNHSIVHHDTASQPDTGAPTISASPTRTLDLVEFAKTAAEGKGGKGGKPADSPSPSGKLGFASKKRRRA